MVGLVVPGNTPSRGRRVTAAVVTGLLVAATPAGASIGPAQAAPAPPPAVQSTPAAAEQALEAPDEAAAARLAYRTRRDVLVTGMTSETSVTYARPDGTFQSTMHLSPVRIRDQAGTWAEVDLTLERRSDGSVRPRAHPRELRLSAGRSASSDALVEVRVAGQRVELGWRGALPEPVLDGDRATYRDVRPGVDLVVQAQRTGFEYFLIVKQPSAAAELTDIGMPLHTGTLSPAERLGGGLELRDATGAAVVQVPPAQMWDAAVDPLSAEPARRADVPMAFATSAGGTDLVLRPARAFFDDPATVFPVTVDPSVSLAPAFDAFVQDTFSSDQSGASMLKLGYVNDADDGCASSCRARSFLSFGVGPTYWDAKVVRAELFLRGIWE
jgi:hypothetical protein